MRCDILGRGGYGLQTAGIRLAILRRALDTRRGVCGGVGK